MNFLRDLIQLKNNRLDYRGSMNIIKLIKVSRIQVMYLSCPKLISS